MITHAGLRRLSRICRRKTTSVSWMNDIGLLLARWLRCGGRGSGSACRAAALGESSRSERPVIVRNTSSSVGRDRLIECSVMPASSSTRSSDGSASAPLTTFSRSAPSSDTATSPTIGCRASSVARLVGGAVDRQRHHVARHLALELVRGAGGDGHAVVDDEHPVAQRVRLVQVVRGEEDGGAEVGAQPPDVLPQVRPALRVKPGGRLVQEDQRRLVDQAERDLKPPPLPAGQRLHQPLVEPAEVELADQRAARRRRVRLAGSGTARPGRAVPRRPGTRGRCRPSSARSPAARSRSAGAPPGGCGAGRRPPTVAVPAVGSQQRGEHPQGGGLARTVRPEEADDLPRLDGEIHPAHRVHGPLPARECPSEAPGLDDRHDRCFPSWVRVTGSRVSSNISMKFKYYRELSFRRFVRASVRTTRRPAGSSPGRPSARPVRRPGRRAARAPPPSCRVELVVPARSPPRVHRSPRRMTARLRSTPRYPLAISRSRSAAISDRADRQPAPAAPAGCPRSSAAVHPVGREQQRHAEGIGPRTPAGLIACSRSVVQLEPPLAGDLRTRSARAGRRTFSVRTASTRPSRSIARSSRYSAPTDTPPHSPTLVSVGEPPDLVPVLRPVPRERPERHQPRQIHEISIMRLISCCQMTFR